MRLTLSTAYSIAIIILLLAACSGGNNREFTFDKEGALVFSMQVLQTHFENDLDAFIALWDDELYTLELEGPYTKKFAAEKTKKNEYFINEILAGEYAAYSLAEYKTDYAPRVLNAAEVNAADPELIPGLRKLGWDFDQDDYIFIGWDTKSGEAGPLWEDTLFFGITHESGEWRLKAFSG